MNTKTRWVLFFLQSGGANNCKHSLWYCNRPFPLSISKWIKWAFLQHRVHDKCREQKSCMRNERQRWNCTFFWKKLAYVMKEFSNLHCKLVISIDCPFLGWTKKKYKNLIFPYVLICFIWTGYVRLKCRERQKWKKRTLP